MVAAGRLWRRTKRGLDGDTGHALTAAAMAAVTWFLADGLGVVTAGARELTPQDAPALVVGAWPDDSLDSVAAMLAQHIPVTTSRVDGAEVLRVASAVVLDA